MYTSVLLANISIKNMNIYLSKHLLKIYLSKAVDISSVTPQVFSILSRALAILSVTTIRRSAVEQKNVNQYIMKTEIQTFF